MSAHTGPFPISALPFKTRFLPVFLLATVLAAGCSTIHIPRVEGVARDARTGAPIPQMVVGCGYYGSRAAFVDRVGTGFGGEEAITDAEGRYALPENKVTVGMTERFGGRACGAYHPLYIKTEWGWDGWGPPDPKRYDPRDDLKISASLDGSIRCDLSALHIKDKFSTPELWNGFVKFLGGKDTRFYGDLKKEGLRYDFDEVFRAWDEVARTVDAGRNIGVIRNNLDRVKNNISAMLKGGY